MSLQSKYKNSGLSLHSNENEDRTRAIEKIADRYAVSVTGHVKGLISHVDDPLARQYLPRPAELNRQPHEEDDPIGDQPHSPVKGIVHRYPDRVLLMPVTVCAVYCRFCFRRETVGPQNKGTLKKSELDTALDYIRNNDNIWEVILSGGDPLILSPARLKALIQILNDIDHVRTIRIHTRLPVADPAKINDDLCDALRSEKALYVSIHTNHVQELSPAVEKAFKKLREADCVLVSQTVLLKNVNDSPQALEDLFRRLVSLRVKPYYLHHPDKAPGTSHFRVPLKQGQNIMSALRGRVSGLCQPAYVLDIPGGHGKVPVGPVYINERKGEYHITDITGKAHTYKDS